MAANDVAENLDVSESTRRHAREKLIDGFRKFQWDNIRCVDEQRIQKVKQPIMHLGDEVIFWGKVPILFFHAKFIVRKHRVEIQVDDDTTQYELDSMKGEIWPNLVTIITVRT